MPSIIDSNNLVLKCIEKSCDDYNGSYPDVSISTTTITCTINLNFHTENIGLYFNDFDDFLIGKRYGNRYSTKIIVSEPYQSKKGSKPSTRVFGNQVSFMFKTDDGKKINVKLFTNGSIHMTGCGDFLKAKACVITLCEKLRKRRAVFVDGKFIELKFILPLPEIDGETEQTFNGVSSLTNNITQLGISPIITTSSITNELKPENIYNFNIRMINICFHQDMCINRKKLTDLLRANGHESNFNQINASVNIKYNIDGKRFFCQEHSNNQVTIFVFQSGLITIAGTKSVEFLMEAYRFINHFVLTHYKEIFTKKVTPMTIVDLLHQMVKKEEKMKIVRMSPENKQKTIYELLR